MLLFVNKSLNYFTLLWIKLFYKRKSLIKCELFASISPYLIIETEGEIFRDCDRHGVETVTLSKYVTEYEQMGKWMVEFLSKFQNSVIKIGRVNSIRVVNALIFVYICMPLLAKWRHHELSFSLRWSRIYFSLVYIFFLLGPPSNLCTEH